MGMYTGLRCKVKIKPEFKNIISDLLYNGKDWDELGYPFFNEFSMLSRSSMIPWGALSYMPEEWEISEELTKWQNTIQDGWWTFQCSLKNYDGEIQTFLTMVLPHIIDEVAHLEVLYEEWDTSAFYDFINGQVVRSKRLGISYFN